MEKTQTTDLKEKFEKDMVIIYKFRYWGINFGKKKIQEITFDEAFGCDFFDWDTNIMIASEWCKRMYEEQRGVGCGRGWMGKIVAMAWEGHPLLTGKVEGKQMEAQI